ncbi:2OG-Fe(II) oxygenase [Floridanema aerugineum]|uniref:2OG-Fe(II) oxygenase n=1 Tax=Floridaenema aerugineum BLCC-F46 TaxID=3153654 RepID=A0ABV4XCD8_9CYAN
MPKADFFTSLGLFVVKDFFDLELCDKIRIESRDAVNNAASVLGKDGKYEVIEEIRKIKYSQVSEETINKVNSCLIAVKPKLEEHFKLELTDCETPQFLRYTKGDFYLPHSDSCNTDNAPQSVKNRQVSAVIFLSSESEELGEEYYGGGALTFYGLIKDPLWQKYGFSLNGEAGLLIAFRCEIWHEVEPIIFGERYTIVSWFF